MSVMASFSSWQETKMHAHEYLLTTVLKEELGFGGFVVSDWKAIDQLSGIYYEKVATAINAGIDMVMLPCSYDLFITALTGAVEQGDVPTTRIDDAVRRILTVKIQMGLFERPFSNDTLLEEVGSEEHRELARAAVRQSLVLLLNEENVLPLDPNERQILLSGGGVHDVGMQCGGWTISWQGANGDITPGTTLIDAIESAVSGDTTVSYDRFGRFEDIEAPAPLGIAVVGERPYAEGRGDDADLALAQSDVKMLERIRQKVDRLVVIIISGRPLIVTDYLDDWDGLVAAWLPGTEAQGIADVLFGDYPFVGQLPYTWPRSADQLPQGTLNQDAALFPLGYGLTTAAE
jgi:beta-glucosidase